MVATPSYTDVKKFELGGMLTDMRSNACVVNLEDTSGAESPVGRRLARPLPQPPHTD